jgi:signal transduction histidine kinase
MSNSAANLYRLLENLLQWARVQQGTITIHREPVNLLAVVQESLSQVSEHSVSKGISITCEVPEHLTMQADLQMLQTIIRNLVSNAIKFTPAGGSIHITAGGNGMIELAVRDTGIGMSAEMVANLFRIDIPTTRKGTGNETGTGLGLLLCQELAGKLNGKITVESSEGKGSCFRLTLQPGES